MNDNDQQGRDLIRIEEVARILGIKVGTVYDKRCRGELPPAYKSGGLRWDRQDILNWLESRKAK